MSEPCAESKSRTTERASRSNMIAAIVDCRSPNLFVANEIALMTLSSYLYVPFVNASA